MAAGRAIAVMLLLVVDAARTGGILAIVVRKQPGRAAVGVIALWSVSVITTVVLARQLGHITAAFDEACG